MIRRIEWRVLVRGGQDVLEAVLAGETVEITRDGETVALFSPPPERALPALRTRKARRRGDFENMFGVRPSRPTVETLGRIRERR